MSSNLADAGRFRTIISRIAAEASTLPERDRLGYIQGAIKHTPDIEDPADREAIFILVTTAATPGASQAPVASPAVHFSQTIAPQQVVNTTQSTVVPPVGSAEGTPRTTTRVVVAVIGAVALIAAAIISGYFVLRAAETNSSASHSVMGEKGHADSGRADTSHRAGRMDD